MAIFVEAVLIRTMADKVRVNWRQLKPVEDRGDLLCPPLLEGTAPADHPKAKTDKVLAIQPDDLSSTFLVSSAWMNFKGLARSQMFWLLVIV